ncbi:hypothetical protein AB0M50_44670 [Nonomuraea fuscirosea]|uniref:hypothetical protein n=1 Tax=Nonomuraea fuscirosea TaxID=1291556 RepID=UPI0034403399
MIQEEPRLSAQEMIEQLESSLSKRRRIRAVTALLAGLVGAVFVTSLWATEPGPLPGGTHTAFAVLTGSCLAWACYGGWVLTRRAPLFATERVIAAWIALAASVTATALVTTIAVIRGTGPLPPLAVGALFVGASLTLAWRAHTRRAHLLHLKRTLGG